MYTVHFTFHMHSCIIYGAVQLLYRFPVQHITDTCRQTTTHTHVHTSGQFRISVCVTNAGPSCGEVTVLNQCAIPNVSV